MLDKFENYLIKKGYSQYTSSGHCSTTYDYAKVRIPKICEREGVNINQLADNISYFVRKYDYGGCEFDYGNKSHKAFINALKRFEEFVNSHKTLL